ncbi:phenylacetaldoxime dehydratase family protein [Drechslerella dactyloides]|uniref:Phenylacetaldoxime dehydratase family protein n=1 Tax=Drechslerella dactyloides TaxID=74499 RepID=A0AAD6NH31_DREDA|nr:phenylacetaldoxime dehydratase family protein [Drechslerella dactyloides]
MDATSEEPQASLPASLEHAIPPHLIVERTQPWHKDARQPPKGASHSFWFGSDIESIVVLYIGLQFLPGTDVDVPVASTRKYLNRVHDGHYYHCETSGLDDEGYQTIVSIAYWKNTQDYRVWKAALPKDWYHEGLELDGPVGAFIEIYTPTVRDLESSYSHTIPHGWGHIADHTTKPTDLCGYLGSMRDRFPRAQSDELIAKGHPKAVNLPAGADSRGRIVAVEPHSNAVVVNSGQRWKLAEEEEREYYHSRIQPKLNIFLTPLAEGLSAGCYFQRFLVMNCPETNSCHTISYSLWHSQSHLEAYVLKKPHRELMSVAIVDYLKRQKSGGAKLELYHEAMVLEEKNQAFEYFNCHPRTGMLRAIMLKS